jgi:multiple sugar transport system substrate-binding protein
MRALVERFHAHEPRIRVRMNALRWDDFYRKVQVATFAGSGPDVGAIHQHRLPTFVERGVILSIDTLTGPAGFVADDFFAPVWRGGAYRGRQYGIPLDVHPLGMYMNRRAFERAGITEPPRGADELEEALARLERSGFEYPFWIPTQWPAHLMFASLIWQFGGAPFSDDASRVSFASAAGERAILFLRRVIERGYSPRAVGLDAQWNAFVNGTNAVLWDGSWMLQNTRHVTGGVRVAPLPQVGVRRAVWANAHQLVLFARPRLDARRLKAALVFFAFLSEQGLAWSECGMVPARNALREAALAGVPEARSFARSLPFVELLPSGPAIGELHDDILQHAVDASLRAPDPVARLAFAERLATDELAALRRPFER